MIRADVPEAFSSDTTRAIPSPALPPAAAGSHPQDIRWRNSLPSCRVAAVNIKRSSPKGGGLFVFTKETSYGIIIEEKNCRVEEI